MNKRSHIYALLPAVLTLALAGCGDDEKKSGGSGSASGGDSTETTPSTPASPAEAEISKDTSKKPEIPAPTGSPPPQLQVRDIVEGKGPAAKAGDALTMQYVGISWSTGEQFDASWDSGRPFEFQLGAGMVIPGWDQGLVGIKKGGRRQLIIPPEMGYGPQGQGPIGPNETLVFVVDAVKVGG